MHVFRTTPGIAPWSGFNAGPVGNRLNQLFKPDKEHENTAAQIGNWERGIRVPSYMEVRKLAEFFDVTMDYLAGKSERDEYDLDRLFLSGKELTFGQKNFVIR